MQLNDHFRVLLRDTVNLSEGRLTQMSDRVDSIYRALTDDDEIGARIVGKDPQGSWAQRTIIKPRPGKEFDADVMIRFEHEPEWEDDPTQYRAALYGALKRHPTYKSMPLTRKCRCVRLTYANEFHVDLVPCVHRNGALYIINGDDEVFELTDPEAFTNWMQDRDGTTGGELRRVIRLMKYLREGSTWTGTRSIILTTVLGERVDAAKTLTDPSYYSGTATALLHLVEDLDDWLQARPNKPSIPDPSGTGLTFDHRWDDTSYLHFRDRMHSYCDMIAAAYHETDEDESLRLWRELFGDGFKGDEQTSGSSSPFILPKSDAPRRSGRSG